MISHKHRCIFVEVPKTGTTSIRSIIGSGRPPHMDLAQKQAAIIYGHQQYGGAATILNYIIPKKKRKKNGEEKFKSYYKFGLVRNPWDRTVSLYKRREGVQLSQQMSFVEFVDWIQYASATCVYPSPHRNQLDWFTDTNGIVLADYIGRFETIENDWEVIREKLGISETLPHKNINPEGRKHYTEYYNKKTRDVIAKKFKTDIEYFGYEFGK
ncbi:MAG: sulfotransferase family 2 domain-containing protein [Leptospirales bacterium]